MAEKDSVKAVVFDMDGVILDSETICDRVWVVAAKEYGLGDITSAIQECRGMNKHDAVDVLKKHFGQDFNGEEYLERTSELFKEIEFSEGIPLMPAVFEAFDYLKGKYRIALASSTRGQSVHRQMTNAKVIDYFETITTGDMVIHSKPDPEIYLMACKSINLKPEDCVAVEDSPNGVRSAYAAGMKVIMVPDKIAPTEEIKAMCWKVCKSLKELKKFL